MGFFRKIKNLFNRIKTIIEEISLFLKGLVYDKYGIPSLSDTTYLIHMTIGWGLVIYTVLVYFPDVDWRLFAVLVSYLAAMMLLKTVKTFTVAWRDIKLSFTQDQTETKEDQS